MLPARHDERRKLIEKTAAFYDVSASTVRRSLRLHHHPQAIYRKDYNEPRVVSQADMKRYCELIAALKLRTTNKKGRHLSSKECIRLLEEHGVETADSLIQTPKITCQNPLDHPSPAHLIYSAQSGMVWY
jgi:hypothetical protein